MKAQLFISQMSKVKCLSHMCVCIYLILIYRKLNIINPYNAAIAHSFVFFVFVVVADGLEFVGLPN